MILFNENIVVPKLFCSGAYPSGPCASQQWRSIDFLWCASPSAAHTAFFPPQNASPCTLPSIPIPVELHISLLAVAEWPSVLLRNGLSPSKDKPWWHPPWQLLDLPSPLGFGSHHSGDSSNLQLLPQGQWVLKTLPKVSLSPSSSSSYRKVPSPQEWLFCKFVI